MKGREGKGVQIQNQRPIRVAYYFFILAKRDAGDGCERSVSGQRFYKIRKGLLRFTTRDQVNPWKGAHGGDIDDRRLGAAQCNH